MKEAYRWLKKDGDYVKIDDKNVLLTCQLDENDNHIVSENAIKVLNLKKDEVYELIYAEPIDGNPENGFMETLASWNVVFDGEKFIPDVNNPDCDFIDLIGYD